MALSTEQGFALCSGIGNYSAGLGTGRAGTERGRMCTDTPRLAAWQATGAEALRSQFLVLLAEAYGSGTGRGGATVLAEALDHVDKTGERFYEAELYRIKGELTLQKLSVISSQLSVPNTQSLTPSTQAEVEGGGGVFSQSH